ncbi:MAG: DUF3352 domain-containing protein [Acidobacteriota bacterium]
MNLRALLTRRNIIIALVVLAALLAVSGYFLLRRPARVEMDRFAPASSLALIEVYNLSDLLDGLTGTDAWKKLAPALGVSSQLRQIGLVTDIMSRTGIGPDEAVIAGRAQYAVALTSLETETGENEDGPYLHFKPRFCLIVETHSSSETAARVIRERASILASRIYGASVVEETEDYSGARLQIYRGPRPERQMIAASSGSLILIANHESAIKSCLDTAAGRAPSLASDNNLKQLRSTVDEDATVFAMVTQSGVEKLSELGPAIFASRLTTDPDRINSIANLFGHLSKQTFAGLLYSLSFDDGRVLEKYLTALRPQVADALSQAVKPAPAASFGSLRLLPRQVEDFTLLNIEGAGDLAERTLKHLTPTLDVVAGVALREFVLSLREQLGVEQNDSLAGAVGSEVALAKFSDQEPTVMLVRVVDKTKVSASVSKYLARGGATVSAEQYAGVEIHVSSHKDRRAAAFIDDFVILGTRDQIARIIDARSNGQNAATDERFQKALTHRTNAAAMISCRPDFQDAGEMMLAISKLTRVTDGSRELLEQTEVKNALNRLPPAISSTEFRWQGVYTETRSSVGIFSLIASLIGNDEK